MDELVVHHHPSPVRRMLPPRVEERVRRLALAEQEAARLALAA